MKKLMYIVWILPIIAVVKLNKGNQLNNDICASVKVISSSIAQIECDKDAIIFDPTYQNGMCLFDKDTGSWHQSSIFNCMCNCNLPEIENGHIFPESIGHGETLEYNCNEGFHKTDNRKVICLDRLWVMLPDNLKDSNISIAFRQKALPVHELLIDKFDGIFPLSLSETSNWTEVCNNEKYFQSLSNDETKLKLCLFYGVNYMIGIVDLKNRLEPACIKTESVLSAGAVAGIISVAVITVLIVVIIVIVRFCKLKRSSRPTTEPNDRHQMLIQQSGSN
ncbi:hypothetical protein ACJMK2_014362 [Sinanodonta woodiana]|uniref:Uncharacterized protein n=1 Tax=Sinanodonta woodiana TaxID=1069815 RepID=A0ABD3V166_SINWO